MERFRFRLARVLEWRQTELELERAKLTALLEERRGLDRAGERLEDARRAAEGLLWRSTRIEAQELAALDGFRAHLLSEREKLERARAGCAGRLAAQQQRVLEADRKVRLLETLKAQRLAVWEHAAALELEKVAAENFLAKWGHERS